MRVNKHGIPGIGVTGKKGKKGKYGNSFYFGTIDSFFSYIGNNTLKDISINYDDIDYDITYAEDELRLLGLAYSEFSKFLDKIPEDYNDNLWICKDKIGIY